ncbi:hypothetical protein [Vibrio sp. RE86]|nr:hypothetical protein [Vibrio sp. RE86]
MKRFFPSNVMLIPFVVRNYADDEQEELIDETIESPELPDPQADE